VLGLTVLGWYLLSPQPDLRKRTFEGKNLAKSPRPNVTPVEIPAPNETPGKKVVGEEEVGGKELDTDWIKVKVGEVNPNISFSIEVAQLKRAGGITLDLSEFPVEPEHETRIVYWDKEKTKIKSQSSYQAGMLNGNSKGYSENGTLLWEKNYKNSILNGLESHYSKSGTLTKQIEHDGKGGSKVVFDLEKGIDER